MFGLSWDQIILILLAALFLLGPERIPVAMKWGMDSLRKVRSMAAGAQAEMRSQLGPEIEELRRQVAELQSLKEISELRALRDLDPRRMVGKGLLGEEFSGGMAGFLGLNQPEGGAATDSTAPTPTAPAATPAASTVAPAATAPTAPSASGDATSGTGAAPAVTTGSPSIWVDEDAT